MYAEADFLFALIKDEDWLGDRAEVIYREHREELWTSRYTLVELLLVSYREELDPERVIANATALVEVRGGEDTVVTAATYVADHGLTPFDAIHLVEADGDEIVSSDAAYDGLAPRLDLRAVDEE